jgi:hypothetical protein
MRYFAESVTGCRAWACVVAAVLLIAVSGGLGTALLPVRAEIPPPIAPSPLPLLSSPPLPSPVSSSSLPPPHLGYGLNVRDPSTVDALFAPLGFEWLKLWEEYGTEQVPTLPQSRYPYQVLFLIDCTARSGDLDAWGDAVEAIAVAGQGLVEAYEICNEPNRRGWLSRDVSPLPPDPDLYVQMLRLAYERIKAVDPAAIVVSAGLAPVGRIQGTCNGWSGNDCGAMDEREYARQMFLLGAGDCFDAFGYHPYGFAYEPERALGELPPEDNGNGFAFRGVEVMRELMEQHDLGHKPVWATEFSWLRDPSEDGRTPDWCHRRDEYEDSFGWMDVPEVRQASYITRAFQYADESWPWMGAMVVWNLDWYDYGWLCDPARYFSVLRVDYGSDDLLGGPFAARGLGAFGTESLLYGDAYVGSTPYTTTLAYDALAAMGKRPGRFGPRLAVVPPALTFLAAVDEPGTRTGVLVPLNTGYRVFTWTATVAAGMAGTGAVGAQVTPTLAITTGVQGTPMTVTLDSTGYATGTFTGVISVTATTTDVLDASQAVTVTLRILSEVYRVRLPVVLRSGP